MKRTAVLICLLFCPFSSYADVVYLKSGEKVEGKVVGRTDASLKIESVGVVLTYYLDEVEKVEEGAGSSSEAANGDVAAPNTEAKAGTDGASGIGGELEKAYNFHIEMMKKVAETQDITLLKDYLPPDQYAEMEQALKTSPEMAGMMFGFLGQAVPDGFRVAREIIDGDKGVLLAESRKSETGIENFLEASLSAAMAPEGAVKNELKPIEAKQYITVLFQKMNGQWKVVKSLISAYNDPRALFKMEGEGAPASVMPKLSNHCGFKKDEQSCGEFDGMMQDECRTCFAQLKNDPSLCDLVAKQLEENDAETFRDHIRVRRFDCLWELARVSGDRTICQKLPDEEIIGRNFQELCLEYTEEAAFLPNVNIFSIDSDNDGLMDKMERYFNTSIVKADTDGDGVNDGAEVEAMTNPLGEGQLGDHLK